MEGRELINQLKEKLECTTDAELARKMSKKPARISQLKGQEITPIVIARIIKDILMANDHVENNEAEQQTSGTDYVEKLKEEFNCNTDTALARILQVKNIANWKVKPEISSAFMARIVKKAFEAGCTNERQEQLIRNDETISNSIKTIIEYIPIRPLHQSGQERVIIKSKDGYGHLKLRNQIENKKGIYIFYNSSCCPVYVGKANNTELWGESNSAYGREYKGQFYGVNYPMEHQHERAYSLSKRIIKLYDIASYYSAYEVHSHLIDKVEALLIRSFINNLSNVRIENLDNV